MHSYLMEKLAEAHRDELLRQAKRSRVIHRRDRVRRPRRLKEVRPDTILTCGPDGLTA